MSAAVAAGLRTGQGEGDSTPIAPLMTEFKPTARARIAPAGLLFLAITSVGWGFNWPVTKYLLGESPPLTLRGVTGVIGALLLARWRCAAAQSAVAEGQWPRLVVAAVLNVTCWMVLMAFALLYLPASEATLIAYTMPVWASLLAWPVLGERPTLLAHDRAGDGVRRARGDYGRQRPLRQRRKAAGDFDGARRRARLCPRHGAGEKAADPAAADHGRGLADRHRLLSDRGRGSGDRDHASGEGDPARLALLFYSTVIQFCVAYVSWFAALARLPASVAAIGTMAVPVIGVVASALALGEPLGPGQIAALVLTLAAVVLATRS